MVQGRIPQRGDVWWTDFDSSVGGEARKIRPAIVVSNDSSNGQLNRVQVVPVTSKVGRLFPSEAYVMLRGKQHKAMADQLSTASKMRLKEFIERISPADMGSVERAIMVQLQLR